MLASRLRRDVIPHRLEVFVIKRRLFSSGHPACTSATATLSSSEAFLGPHYDLSCFQIQAMWHDAREWDCHGLSATKF